MADLLKENEELKKGKMTAEQKAEYERQQAEERIKEKDRELQEREIRLIKLDILSELELPKYPDQMQKLQVLIHPNALEASKFLLFHPEGLYCSFPQTHKA